MNSTGKTSEPNTAKRGCQACKRKTLMKITCRCEMIVCLDCRYPELHDCAFDYKEEARQLLEKNNPVVVSEKLEKV